MAKRNFHLNIREGWVEGVKAALGQYVATPSPGSTNKVRLVDDIAKKSLDGLGDLQRLFDELDRQIVGPKEIGANSVGVS